LYTLESSYRRTLCINGTSIVADKVEETTSAGTSPSDLAIGIYNSRVYVVDPTSVTEFDSNLNKISTTVGDFFTGYNETLSKLTVDGENYLVAMGYAIRMPDLQVISVKLNPSYNRYTSYATPISWGSSVFSEHFLVACAVTGTYSNLYNTHSENNPFKIFNVDLSYKAVKGAKA
jgi:hypothetical protein